MVTGHSLADNNKNRKPFNGVGGGRGGYGGREGERGKERRRGDRGVGERPTKPEAFTWPFPETVCWPLV